MLVKEKVYVLFTTALVVLLVLLPILPWPALEDALKESTFLRSFTTNCCCRFRHGRPWGGGGPQREHLFAVFQHELGVKSYGGPGGGPQREHHFAVLSVN